MAYTMTQMHEHDLFVRAMGSYIPASKVWVEVRGWEDPRPHFVIQFKNGVVFYGGIKAAVINEARTYAEATFTLTGEYP